MTPDRVRLEMIKERTKWFQNRLNPVNTEASLNHGNISWLVERLERALTLLEEEKCPIHPEYGPVDAFLSRFEEEK